MHYLHSAKPFDEHPLIHPLPSTGILKNHAYLKLIESNIECQLYLENRKKNLIPIIQNMQILNKL